MPFSFVTRDATEKNADPWNQRSEELFHSRSVFLIRGSDTRKIRALTVARTGASRAEMSSAIHTKGARLGFF
jgi:hypothetical protein